MGPKKGTKQATGTAQPTLSFQSRKPSVPSPARKKARNFTTAASVTSVPSTPPKRRTTRGRSATPTLVPASSDEEGAVSEEDFSELRTPAGPSKGASHGFKDDPFIVTSSPLARGPVTPLRSKTAAKGGHANIAAKPPLELSTAIPVSVESRAPSPGAIHQTTEEKLREKRPLDVKSREVKGLMKDAKVAMGGMAPIHADPSTHNDVHHILRVFDMTSAYGPCVGMTRLQRWERAKKWGLNPPEEIRNILTTVEGQRDVAYKENVLYEWV